MKKFRILLLVVLLVIAAAAIYGYYLFNMPHKNVKSAIPSMVFTSDSLFKEIMAKDSIALLAYHNKVIQVTGRISRIEAPNDTIINIFLAVTGKSSDDISCAMDPEYFGLLKNLKAGDDLTVKGIFSGVNKFDDKDLGISMNDIDLTRCVAERK